MKFHTSMDALTDELIHYFASLPVRRKAAILHLVQAEADAATGPSKTDRATWKGALLNTSVWSESEIDAIQQARSWLQQWTPKSF